MKRIQRLNEDESSVAMNLFFLQYLTEENVGVMTDRNIQHLCLNMMMNCDKARKCQKAANQHLYCNEG